MLLSPRSKPVRFAAKHLSGTPARLIKRIIAGPRYRQQLGAARQGFKEFGSRYPHPNIFVAGLPKSGTTWLESMLSSIPGFHDVMLPEAVAHEQRTGESITFDIPENTFDRLQGSLSVLKLHVWGSDHNVAILEKAGVPYTVLYRDLRDVAVSHSFYVAKTPWHPEYDAYKDLSPHDALRHFADTLLPINVEWIKSWRKRRGSKLCLVTTYEEMLADSKSVLDRVLELYDMPDRESLSKTLIEANSFSRMSGGGKDQFFRKGVAGDWVNHFPEDLIPVYEAAIKEAERDS